MAVKKKRAPKKDVPKFIKVGQGIYADESAPNLVIINPRELLEANDIPVTQEGLFSMYAIQVKQAKDEGLEVVLINDDDEVETLEVASSHIDPQIIDPGPDVGYIGPERRKFPRN